MHPTRGSTRSTLKRKAFAQAHTCALNNSCELAHVKDSSLVNSVLLDHLPVMEHIKLLGCILAGVQHNSFFATWMIRKELSDIIDGITHNHPAIGVGLVTGDISSGRHGCNSDTIQRANK